MAIKLVSFDLDGTLVHYNDGHYGSSWDALTYVSGKIDEVNAMVEYYYLKKDKYEEWIEKNAELMKGTPLRKIKNALLPPPYTKGVRKTVAELSHMYTVGILSSGVDIVARYIQKELGMHFCVCNELHADNYILDGAVTMNVNLWKKDDNIRQIAKSFNISPSEIAMVGDHDNDIPAFEAAGLGIAFSPKNEEVKNAADAWTDDFREIPAIIERLE